MKKILGAIYNIIKIIKYQRMNSIREREELKSLDNDNIEQDKFR